MKNDHCAFQFCSSFSHFVGVAGHMIHILAKFTFATNVVENACKQSWLVPCLIVVHLHIISIISVPCLEFQTEHFLFLQYAFLVPSATLFAGGIVNYCCLLVTPGEVGKYSINNLFAKWPLGACDI